jgi:hypothetical protein
MTLCVDKIYQLSIRIGLLEATIRNAIEAIERGSTSAPVLESLKAVLRTNGEVGQEDEKQD